MARDGERRRFIERAAEETKLEKDLIKRDLGKLSAGAGAGADGPRSTRRWLLPAGRVCRT